MVQLKSLLSEQIQLNEQAAEWKDANTVNIISQLGGKREQIGGINAEIKYKMPNVYNLESELLYMEIRLAQNGEASMLTAKNMKENRYYKATTSTGNPRIYLYTDSERTKPLGYIFKSNEPDGRLMWWSFSKQAKSGLVKRPPKTASPSPEAKRSWIDIVQTIGDWAGIIPGVGDGIDLVNALVYLVRGKWVDAALSAIAIIPFAGSAIKLGVKNAPDLIRLLQNSFFDPKAAKAFWLALVKRGIVSPKVLIKAVDGMDDVISWLTSNKKNISDRVSDFAGNAAEVDRAMDTFTSWLQVNRNELKQLLKSPDTIGGTIKGSKLPPSAVTGEKGLRSAIYRYGKAVVFLPVRTLTYLPYSKFFDENKVEYVLRLLKKRFVDIYKNNPEKLYGLLKTASNVDPYFKAFNNILVTYQRQIKDIISNNGQLTGQALIDAYKNIGLTATKSTRNPYMVDLTLSTLDGFQKFLDFAIKNNLTAILGSMVNSATNLAMKYNHAVWIKISEMDFKNLGRLLVDPGFDTSGKLLQWTNSAAAAMKQLAKDPRKWIDVWGNEANYTRQEYLKSEERDAGAIIMPAVIAGAKNVYNKEEFSAFRTGVDMMHAFIDGFLNKAGVTPADTAEIPMDKTGAPLNK